jgi:type I restriction-modification system DNA methylase subunit
MDATIKKEVDKQQLRGPKRVKATGEVFTPVDLCLKVILEVPVSLLKNPDSKFLDNSCGDGNFLVALSKVLRKYHDMGHVLNQMIYGVDLMEDNVAVCRERLGLTEEMLGWNHVICADALTFDYKFETS